MADQQCSTLDAPRVPAPGAVTPHPQEPGTRPARALPYALHLSDEVAAGVTQGLRLSFDNHGRQGASLWARSRAASLAPRCYTLAAGGHLLWLARRLDIADPTNCLMLFRANRQTGALIALSLAIACWFG